MEYTAALFWIIAGLTGLCAIAMVVTQNIVRSATWLLFTLAGASGIFFLLGADFVGATQLLVYVGGTLVLVVFGVMLTAQGPFISMKTGAAEWAVSLIVGVMLYSVLALSIVGATARDGDSEPSAAERTKEQQAAANLDNPALPYNTVDLGQSLLGIEQATPPAAISNLPPKTPQYPRKQISYFLPFEIVSVHLLVVLIGAAYLARAKRRRGAIAS